MNLNLNKKDRLIFKLIDVLFCGETDLEQLKESLKILADELGSEAVWISHLDENSVGLVVSEKLSSDFERFEKKYHKNCQCKLLTKNNDKNYDVFYVNHCTYLTEDLKYKINFHYHYSIPLKAKKDYIGMLNIAFDKDKSIDDDVIDLISKIYSSAFSNYLYCRKLEEQSKELIKKNNDLEVLVSAISHDLKNPIISAKGFFKIIDERFSKKLNKNMQWYLKCIEKSILRAEELVKDLLNLNNVEKMLNIREEVNLNDTIKASVRNISGLVKNRKPKISILGEKLTLKSNWHALFHIFTNLIANAIKYTPDDRRPIVKIIIEKEKNLVSIKVADNGIGLTSKELQNIFRPFSRVKTLDREGSGVGLSIVKKLVEGLGGTINVESEKYVGTTFILNFPLAESGAEGEIRTRTGLTPLDPEPSVSASSTTSASITTLYEEKLKRSRS